MLTTKTQKGSIRLFRCGDVRLSLDNIRHSCNKRGRPHDATKPVSDFDTNCYFLSWLDILVSRMLQMDETFVSLDQWTSWVSLNPEVYDLSRADRFAQRIMRQGFLEPLTGRVARPSDIDGSHSNWREGLVAHGLNTRMRAVLALLDECVGDRPKGEVSIFATEGVTAFALKMRGIFAKFLGSEYGLNEAAVRGLYPIVHQDLMALTLPSKSFDIVTTNEVLEHVPDLDAALREIVRVLKPGGWHIGTHPFHFTRTLGDLRSRLVDGRIEYLKEPEYHGNPVDPAGGSLVFETPAWDIIERAQAAGFARAHMRFVASETYGIVTQNMGVFVLCAQVG